MNHLAIVGIGLILTQVGKEKEARFIGWVIASLGAANAIYDIVKGYFI